MISEINLKGNYKEIMTTEQKYERLQKFGRCSYKGNIRITSTKLFSFEMMSEINMECNYKEIIFTEQKCETFTEVPKIHLKR